MYLFVTTKCNLACMHCCHNCRPGRGQHMPADVFEHVCRYLDRHSPTDVVFGGGEPTLHPDLLPMLETAIRVSRRSVFMITNGTCSTDLWKKLVKVRGLDLQVSDGPMYADSIVPQNSFVMNSAAQRGMRWNSGYDHHIEIELTGRAVRNQKAIEHRVRERGWHVEFQPGLDSEICVLPNGHVCAWGSGGVYKEFGLLSARECDRAEMFAYGRKRRHGLA